MLSPEQTKLRLQESELHRLRDENKRLKTRVADLTDALKEIVTALAETLPSSYKFKLLSRIKTIGTGE